MNATVSIVVAAVSVFVLSSVWYTALGSVEVSVLGPDAPDRGGRPSPLKASLELASGRGAAQVRMLAPIAVPPRLPRKMPVRAYPFKDCRW